MNRGSSNQFGSLYHYLLVVNPDNYVSSRIRRIKEYFDIHYGCRSAPFQIPHITLLNFLQFEALQKPTVDGLSKLAKSIKPFRVELDGFNQFPSNGTVYVDVSTQTSLHQIVDRIKSNHKELIRGNISAVKYASKFHVTIARGMSEGQHKKAWGEWQDKDIQHTFIANEMKLLRRAFTNSSKKYEGLSFPFTGSFDPPEQMSLF